MAKRVLLILLLFALKALSQDTSEWVSIDCGSEKNYQDSNGINWYTDEYFIKTGKNKPVPPSSNAFVLEQMESLRVFTQQNKNCYSLPSTEVRYLIRAGFYYGNYDGLKNPPTFDLMFDGNKWVTVVTSTKEPVYHEMIYSATGNNISVCVAQTHDNEFPFMSSLEALPLPADMYAGMTNNIAWFSNFRFHYGGTDVIWYPDDHYNRIWYPSNPPGLVQVTAEFTYFQTNVNEPPESAFRQALESPNSTDPIDLLLQFDDETNRLNYVVLYYIEVSDLEFNETRSFNISVNGQDLGRTISPEYGICGGILTKTNSEGTLKVELYPTVESTLPPIIGALEVYTASQTLVTTGTSQDDLDGLALFISTFRELRGWSGDPCLPNDTVWQWLNCTGDDPPRVISLSLSGYGLKGNLPYFDQMQALEIIDLSNNYIDGPIPDFLGNLPNLRKLNLAYNNFSGNIPPSLAKNKNLTYNITGNPLLHHKGKKVALIVGLAVGLPVALVLVLLLVYYFCWRKQKPTQEQVEFGNLPGSDQDRPTQEQVELGNLHGPNQVRLQRGEDDIGMNGGEPPQPAVIPTMDMNELNDLLRQHARFGANADHKAGPT